MTQPTFNKNELLLQDAAEVLSAAALDTFDPDKDMAPASEPTDTEARLPFIPKCITQAPVPRNLKDDPTALMIGWLSHIPRWKPGSVIKFTGWRMGYDTEEDAFHAWDQLCLAAKAWNDADIGIKFKSVARAKDANFAICHGADNPGVLASAFFPNNNKFNLLYVYKESFEPGRRGNLWKTLTHELGHIMGLRHEFAGKGVVQLTPTWEHKEDAKGAVEFGESNNLSVMNYGNESHEIQPSDIKWAKKFYALDEDEMVKGTPIRDYDASVEGRDLLFS